MTPRDSNQTIFAVTVNGYWRRLRPLALVVALTAAACSGDNAGDTAADSPTDDTESTTETTAPAIDEPSSSTPAVPTDEADILLSSGLQAHVEGRVDDARAIYLEVLALDSGNVFAHFNLGLIAHSEGDLDGANASYDLALTYDPLYVPALFNSGIVATERNDIARAIEFYRLVVRIDDSYAQAHLNLGVLLLNGGEEDEGLAEINRAYELDPAVVFASDPTS